MAGPTLMNDADNKPTGGGRDRLELVVAVVGIGAAVAVQAWALWRAVLWAASRF